MNGCRVIRTVTLAAGVCVGLAWTGCPVSLTGGSVGVVVDPAAPKTVRFAATEMTNLLAQVLGADVLLSTAAVPGRTNLFLGKGAWCASADADVDALPRDGFVIDVRDVRVVICGRDDPDVDMFARATRNGGNSQWYERATLFGVYEFLERFAGVRFYFPGALGTIVPRRPSLDVPDGHWSMRPDWIARYYSHTDDALGTWYEDLPKGEWRLQTNLELYRLRMETRRIPCCHGQAKCRYTERFAKTHPEYFHMGAKGHRRTEFDPKNRAANSQLCHTSPVWDVIYADAKAALLDGKPYFDAMPNDGMFKCCCPDCQAYYTRARTPGYWATELIWEKTVKLANRLIDEKVPGFVTQMAYASYRGVPDVEIPTNVMVMVAETGAWCEPRADEFRREIDEIAAWHRKAGGRTWMWNYIGKYGPAKLPDVPASAPHAMGRFLKAAAPFVFGAYQESHMDRFFFNYLPLYVFSRIAWDNAADPEAILEEHNRLMFGAAAKPMDAYIRVQEFAWTHKVVGRTVETELGPSVVVPSEYDLWTKVYSDKVVAHLGGLLAQAESAVPADSPEARRIALYRRETFEPLVARRRRALDAADVAKIPPVSAADIVRRGSFDDPRGWILNRGEIAYDDREFVSAPRSLRIVCTDKSTEVSPAGFWRAYATCNLTGKMKPSTRYRLSYAVKLENVIPTRKRGGVTMGVYTKGCQFYPEMRLRGTTPWIRQTAEFTTPAELGPKQLVRPLISEAYGTAWFDDIRLEELPAEER